MSKKQIFGALCCFAASALLLLPIGGGGGTVDPDDPNPIVINDEVHKAFVTYERLWRKHRLDIANKIDSGELATETATWDALATAGEPMREVAFDTVNKNEAAAIGNPWNPQAHSKILRGYSDAVRE